MRVSLRPALVAVLVVVSAGCGDAALGDLLVHYQLGSGTLTCQSRGVQVIRVTLANSEREPLVEEAVCSDASRQVLIRQVPADVYTVTVEGIVAAETIAYRGELGNVRVAADTVTETRDIALQAVPPGLRVVWSFAEPGMCATHGVSQVQVVAWLGSEIREVDEVFDCNSGVAQMELRAGSYDLRVRGIDSTTQNYTYGWDRNGIELQAGSGMVQVVAVLDECVGPCTAP